ncbi:hypothetical protein [Bdellovibrio bacteriovorus]|uniref:hypothetical protein n=1 Tax=Bdellovibrio TaxID=958 RepID=UPI0035A82E63
MAKIIKYFWRFLSVITICIFLWFSITIGFTNLLRFPYYVYVLRWRDFQEADFLEHYWGVKSFDSKLWKAGVDRASQAIDLSLSNKLIGMSRNEIEALLGPPDGSYALSDSNLTYSVIDQTIKTNEKSMGTRWSFVVFMNEGSATKTKFYKSCCE